MAARQLLTYRNGLFVWLGPYDTKEIPKGAGFRFNWDAKHWYTDSTEVAMKLKGYCDPAAAEAINEALRRRERQIEASSAVEANINVPAPNGLGYMGFQKAGIAYAAMRPGTLIADEMGLGKTIQALGLVNYDHSIDNVLVICPASLKLNWEREARKWLVRPFRIGVVESKSWPENTNFVIINYDILDRHINRIRSRKWDLAVLDEAHYIKSPEAKRTKLVLGERRWDPAKRSMEVLSPPIPARIRLALTGTPILNRPQEMWSLVDWCLMDVAIWDRFEHFRSRTKFWTRYAGYREGRYGWEFGGPQNLPELQREARLSFMVRRTKNQVLTDLPPKRRQVIEISSEGYENILAREREAFERQKQRLARAEEEMLIAKAAGDEEAYRRAVAQLREAYSVSFEEMSRVRHEVGLATVDAAEDFLADVIESLDKVVVFAHHHDVVDRLMEIAAKVCKDKRAAVKLVGGMSGSDKQESVDRFQNDPAVRVFVGSITAAGVGITLTAASHVIFAELDWVPANLSQAEDRCHRIGQRDSVTVQHLVLEGSLTARMAKIVIEKQTAIDQAMDKDLMAPFAQEVVTPADAENETSARAKTVSRESWKQQAAAMTQSQIRLVHMFLRSLAGACDYAKLQDDCGFNKMDAGIGHRLADTPEQAFTPGMAVLGKMICRKYWRQLIENYGTEPFDEVYGRGEAERLQSRRKNPVRGAERGAEPDFIEDMELSANW